jgi:hypothetical protein
MHYRSLLSHGCHLRSGIGIGSNEHAKARSRGIIRAATTGKITNSFG